MPQRKKRDPRLRIDRVGEIKKNNEGYEMQIIEYNNRDDVLIKFLDKGGYQKRVQYSNFKYGNIHNLWMHLYEENVNKIGLKMTIVAWRKSTDIDIEFEDGIRKTTTYTNFKKGNVSHPNINYHQHLIDSKVGMETRNNQGSIMKIIEYKGQNTVLIEFQDAYKYRTEVKFKNFKSGNVHNPYHPTIEGVGITGVNCPVKNEYGDIVKPYQTWVLVLRRCYSKSTKEKWPTYENATCCEEWKLYENFYNWIVNEENYDIWKNLPRSGIDKDILIKGNKLYCPEKCVLVPQEINSLFTKSDKSRGNWPIGVTYIYKTDKFEAQCNDLHKKSIYLGVYDTPEEAFYVYKEYKESLIKNTAIEYYNNGQISKKCYDAMMNYVVEEDD